MAMKKLLLLLFLTFFSLQAFAQDPDLYRTWYLYFLQDTDMGTPYEVSEISPPIHPFITISGDLSFYGEGACNNFNGNYEHLGTNEMSAINFNNTTNDCGIQIHNSFENSFFGFMYGFWYEITQESNGLTLTLNSPLMGSAIFNEFPLSTPDFTLNNVSIYPNPVTSTLFISSENIAIEKFVVFSIFGEKVLDVNNSNNTLDVSPLSEGMYFLEISSPEGKVIQKFIKK